ncbi:MAG: uracil-DNA glycosylase [Brucellaceae bacterium]|nr:uracil-DNA glycosylase [Brucellaceae bacterium]
MSDTAITANWEDLIRFYAESGVDSALNDAPVDRFAEAAALAAVQPKRAAQPDNTMRNNAAAPAGNAQRAPRQNPASPANQQQRAQQTPVPAQASIAPEVLLEEARKLAGNADSLDMLQQAMAGFDGCRLKFTAKNICFADGSANADLMVIGDTPGRDDDLEGIPFSGPAGHMLERILAAINLKREQVYLANTLPWRPPGNRPATPLELDLCRPFLDRQIELVAPKVIVALGDPAAKALTGSREPIYKLRGNWHSLTTAGAQTVAIMPSLHPDYLLRTPAQKRFAWEDWLMVKMRLEGNEA